MSSLHKTILCVDDDVDDRYLLSNAINTINPSIEVVEAGNGLEAIRYLNEAKERNDLPCLVVLDINMPVLDGKKTLEKIKTDTSLGSVPIIVFTSSNNPNDRAAFHSQGVDMVTKPDNYVYFQQLVQNFLVLCP